MSSSNKYISKPSEVTAVRFTGTFKVLQKEMTEVFGSGSLRRIREDNRIGPNRVIFRVTELYVEANNTWVTITPGEWILRDSVGLYPCKDEIFQLKYEKKED